MFARRLEPTRVKHFSDAPLLGSWPYMQTLGLVGEAFFKHLEITAVKSFVIFNINNNNCV